MRTGGFVVPLLVAFCVLGTLAPSAQALLFVSTGQSGANVQCDENHTQFWTYTVSANVADVNGGLFVMKRGPSTTEDIVFLLIEGEFSDWGTAPELRTVTLTPASFTQSYANVLFQWGTDIDLTMGTTYTAILNSLTAQDQQSQAYFIKGGSTRPLFFVDENGDPVDPPGGGEIVWEYFIPEPSVAVLGLLCLAGLGLRRKQR